MYIYCVCVSIYTYTYIHTYIDTHTCIYIYIYMHITYIIYMYNIWTYIQADDERGSPKKWERPRKASVSATDTASGYIYRRTMREACLRSGDALVRPLRLQLTSPLPSAMELLLRVCRMLTYADVCWRMSAVCWRMSAVCWHRLCRPLNLSKLTTSK
jgi:hypothetical protein